MVALLCQHLNRAGQHMKDKADLKCSYRVFNCNGAIGVLEATNLRERRCSGRARLPMDEGHVAPGFDCNRICQEPHT